VVRFVGVSQSQNQITATYRWITYTAPWVI
jgi:hypothetical protein